ncbi:GNAT family N-acetyltransferase [Aequorivita sp. Q41]|uniref:GNAT family N-acetyltransferase n=1 Tax=Aequorivita sp. Q41 TaxID=3153300 RepID=UPI0032423827
MQIIDDKEKNRFVVIIDAHQAYIEYSLKSDYYSLNHTIVDKELSGKGVASELTEKVLMEIKQRGLKIVPSCPFIKKFIAKHPEWEPLVLSR